MPTWSWGLMAPNDQFLFGAHGVLYRVDLGSGVPGTPQAIVRGLDVRTSLIGAVVPDPGGRYVLVRRAAHTELVYASLQSPDPDGVVPLAAPEGTEFRELLPTHDGRGAFVRHDPRGLQYVALEGGPGSWVSVDPGAYWVLQRRAIRPHATAQGLAYDGEPQSVYVGVGQSGPLPPQPLRPGGSDAEILWSPDGRWLVVSTKAHSEELEFALYRLGDTHEPRLEKLFYDEGATLSNLASLFAPDSRFLYVTRGKARIERLSLQEGDIEDPELVLDAEPLGLSRLSLTAVSPDAATLLVSTSSVDGAGRSGIVRLTDTDVGPLEFLGPEPPRGQYASSARFSPDGRQVSYFQGEPFDGLKTLMLVELDAPTQAHLAHPVAGFTEFARSE